MHSSMDGRPYIATKFALDLRRKIFAEHLGMFSLSEYQRIMDDSTCAEMEREGQELYKNVLVKRYQRKARLKSAITREQAVTYGDSAWNKICLMHSAGNVNSLIERGEKREKQQSQHTTNPTGYGARQENPGIFHRDNTENTARLPNASDPSVFENAVDILAQSSCTLDDQRMVHHRMHSSFERPAVFDPVSDPVKSSKLF